MKRLYIFISVIYCFSFVFSSCKEEPIELLAYKNHCFVNGEEVGYEQIIRIDPTKDDPFFPLYEFWRNESGLYFRLKITQSCYYKESIKNQFRPLFHFDLFVAGDGTFEEGKDYIYPDSKAAFFSESVDYIQYEPFYNTPFGVAVKPLSCTCRFEYSDYEEAYRDKVLNFYYDYEVVVIGLDLEAKKIGWPQVGDTIKVTKGHFRESLFCTPKEWIYSYITPNKQ